MEYTLEMKWPVSFKWLIETMRLVSMDFIEWFDIGCITSFTFFGKYFFAVSLPIMLMTGVYITYHVTKRKQGEEKAFTTTTTMAFIIIFVLYPFVSQTIFSGFSCRDLGPAESWLNADYQISCLSLTWKVWLMFGLITTVLWPVGVPVCTLLILLRNRSYMWVKNAPERDKFAFIVGDYKPEFFYWECELVALVFVLNNLAAGKCELRCVLTE